MISPKNKASKRRIIERDSDTEFADLGVGTARQRQHHEDQHGGDGGGRKSSKHQAFYSLIFHRNFKINEKCISEA